MVSAEEDMSAADAPTIVELSADDVLRARTEAVAKAGVGRKADHLLEVLNQKIRSLPGVRTTETFVYLKLRKQLYNWGTR